MTSTLPSMAQREQQRLQSHRDTAILLQLPHNNEEHDDVPHDIIGATITAIGMFADEALATDKLVIEYRPTDSDTLKRVVFGFTDTGMWIESEQPIS